MKTPKIPNEFKELSDNHMISSSDILKFFNYKAKSLTSVTGYVDKGLIPYPIRSNKHWNDKRMRNYWRLGDLRKMISNA